MAGLPSPTFKPQAIPGPGVATLYTFGDSILDCGGYNAHGVHPGALLVRNRDDLFPEHAGRDLASGGPARLVHRAVDGATSHGLAAQARGLAPDADGIGLLTIGGNDLLAGLATDEGDGVERFRARVAAFLDALPLPRVLVGTVYDPTFGDDRLNFLGVDPTLPRRNLARVNAALRELGEARGACVDVHAHFLKGDASWFTRVIEPSLRGASEVRAAFLPHVLAATARPRTA